MYQQPTTSAPGHLVIAAVPIADNAAKRTYLVFAVSLLQHKRELAESPELQTDLVFVDHLKIYISDIIQRALN